MSFAEGLKAGSSFMQGILDNQRQNKLDQRAEEEHQYRVSERNRLAGARDKMLAGLPTDSPVTSEVPPVAAVAPIADTSQPTPPPPGSVAATGGGGVPPIPPAGGLQTPAPAGAAPAAPAAPPAPPAGGLQTPAPVAAAPAAPPAPPKRPTQTDIDRKYYRSAAEYAIQSGDSAGATAAMGKLRQVEQDDAYNVVSSWTPEQRAERFRKLNTNVSEIPLLSIGPAGKNGRRFLQIDPKTGKEGKEFTLNASQQDKLLTADVMRERGFGKEASELASSVSKDVAEAIKAANETVGKVATQNEQVTHNVKTEDNASANTGIARERLGLEKQKMEEERFSNAKMYQDAEGNVYETINQTNKKGGLDTKIFKLSGESGKREEIGTLPKGVKFMGTGKGGGGGKDTAAPEVGSIMQRPDKTFYKVGGVNRETGEAIELGVRALSPEARTPTLEKAGIPSGIAEQMEWTTGGASPGEHIQFNGKYYSATGPNDPGLKKLAEAVKASGEHDAKMNEIGARYRNDRNMYENPPPPREPEIASPLGMGLGL